MHIPDNAIYKYKIPFELPTVKTIGWLDSKHDYPKGDVSEEIVCKLRNCTIRRNSKFDLHVNRVRGVHPCNFCGNDIGIHIEGQNQVMLGMSEIWVPFNDGWFAAPSLIVHYIDRHEYQPPSAFLEAVRNLNLGNEVNSQKAFEEIVKPIMLKRG